MFQGVRNVSGCFKVSVDNVLISYLLKDRHSPDQITIPLLKVTELLPVTVAVGVTLGGEVIGCSWKW